MLNLAKSHGLTAPPDGLRPAWQCMQATWLQTGDKLKENLNKWVATHTVRNADTSLLVHCKVKLSDNIHSRSVGCINMIRHQIQINPIEHLREILDGCVRQHSPPPSSRHQNEGISFGRMFLQWSARDFGNQCQVTLKLLWRHVLLINTLYVVYFFNLSPDCSSMSDRCGKKQQFVCHNNVIQ